MEQQLEQLAARVFRYACVVTGSPLLAEDLTQEALLRAWQRRPQLEGPEALRFWLFRVVSNLWVDHCRRCQRQPTSGPLRAQLEDGALPVDRSLMLREDVRAVVAALDRLPDRQRQVVYLSACESFSHDEVADLLQISTAAVKSSLCAGRKRMRELLQAMIPIL